MGLFSKKPKDFLPSTAQEPHVCQFTDGTQLNVTTVRWRCEKCSRFIDVRDIAPPGH